MKGDNTKLEPIDGWIEPCIHSEHNPPTHIVIPPGQQLKHRCPSCGKERTITSPNVIF